MADFPYCLDGDVSEVSIEADMPCEVCIISGRDLQVLFDSDPKMMLHNVRILKNLFKMVYSRSLDHYRYTARGRYCRLLDRCPQVVQMLSLKDIASFLRPVGSKRQSRAPQHFPHLSEQDSQRDNVW